GQILRTDTHFALRLPFVLIQVGKPLPAMEAERGAIADFLDRKSLGSLMQIDQRPAALLGNPAEGAFERGMALAAGRAEYVAHQAMRVHADQNWRIAGLKIATNQGYVRLAAVNFARIRNQPEFSQTGIYQRFAHAMHVTFMRHAEADELGHGEHLHRVHAAEFDQVGHARHAAIVFHDFADDSGGDHARQPRQIDGSFRLACAHQHSPLARAKREDVSGTRQVGRPGRRIDRDLNGAGAIVGGDAGRHAGARVDRLTEGSAELRSIFRGHGTDVEMFEALFGHGQAYQAASELGHKVDGLGRDLLGGQGEVAFVFAVFVVDHNDHAAGADFLNRIGNVGEWRLGTHIVAILALDPDPRRRTAVPVPHALFVRTRRSVRVPRRGIGGGWLARSGRRLGRLRPR